MTSARSEGAVFFPTIKLTGAAGLARADLGTFLNWPREL